MPHLFHLLSQLSPLPLLPNSPAFSLTIFSPSSPTLSPYSSPIAQQSYSFLSSHSLALLPQSIILPSGTLNPFYCSRPNLSLSIFSPNSPLILAFLTLLYHPLSPIHVHIHQLSHPTIPFSTISFLLATLSHPTNPYVSSHLLATLFRITNTTLSECTLALLSHPPYRINPSLPHSLVQNPIFLFNSLTLLTYPTYYLASFFYLAQLIPNPLSPSTLSLPHTQLSFASTRPTLLLQSLTTHSHLIYIGNTNPSISLIHPVSNSTLSPHSPIYPTY